MKLTRWLQRELRCGKRQARAIIADGRVELDGGVVQKVTSFVDAFTNISVDGKVLQDRERIAIALHKPVGLVSATKDDEHQTVMSLLPEEWRDDLHLAGRLDKATTGLLILTNDSRISEATTEPDRAVGKVYEVRLRDPLAEDTAATFAAGIYLAYEDITTSPCELEEMGDRRVRLTLYEGAYHQVKRMFHAVGNHVVGLHRVAVGGVSLGDLAEGQWRNLTADELAGIAAQK